MGAAGAEVDVALESENSPLKAETKEVYLRHYLAEPFIILPKSTTTAIARGINFASFSDSEDCPRIVHT